MTHPSTPPPPAYFGNSPVLRLLRLGLGASQWLWPALAVRAANRLFVTPHPLRWFSWLTRRHRWQAGWQVETWPFERASVTVYARPASTPGPVALLLHGWGGHAGQLLALAEVMEAQGLHPVIVEMPAHGRSGGAVSNLPQFARAVDYVAARLQQ
jgi:pimeloyl-ACP methyl ester carboxylesterase